jgi:hypothetical protein
MNFRKTAILLIGVGLPLVAVIMETEATSAETVNASTVRSAFHYIAIESDSDS